MNFRKILVAVSAACILSAVGDQVNLEDGSILYGDVQQILNGKVVMKTSFAGELTLDASKVESISTDDKVNVSYEGKKLSGIFIGNSLKYTDMDCMPMDFSKVEAVWQSGSEDPTLPKPPEGRKWAYEAAADIAGKKGNTNKVTFGGSLKATLSGPQDKLLLYVNGKHDRENHVTSEKAIALGADYESRIAGSSNSWYARSEYKYDKYNDLDPLWTSAAGYGFYLMDKDNAKIRLRAGLSYVYKDHVSDAKSDSDIGLDTNYHHEFKIAKLGFIDNLGVLVTDVTWNPVFDDFNDYRLYHESSLSIPLNGSKYWSIRLGVSHDYYSRVTPDKKHLDTTYFARLVLTWQ